MAASSAGTLTPSPVVAVPRPRSWSAVPPRVETLHTEKPHVDEQLSADDVSDIDTSVTRAGATDAPVAVDRETPGDVEVPSFHPPSTRRRTFAAVVGIAAALVVATVAVREFARPGERPVAAAAARPPVRAPERAPEPPRQAPIPPPAPVVSEAVDTKVVAPEPATLAPPEAPSTAVAVTIKTIPEDAVIFRARQRLGVGVVEVSVERNEKQRFTALLDGYVPSNFTLDGTRDSITIRLKRVPKREPAPPPETDTPVAATPSQDANTATAVPTSTAAATAAPTPVAPSAESTPPAAPTPDVAPPAPSPVEPAR